MCVVVGEPGAVFKVAREDREGSPEAGIHELKWGGKGSWLRPPWGVSGTAIQAKDSVSQALK